MNKKLIQKIAAIAVITFVLIGLVGSTLYF